MEEKLICATEVRSPPTLGTGKLSVKAGEWPRQAGGPQGVWRSDAAVQWKQRGPARTSWGDEPHSDGPRKVCLTRTGSGWVWPLASFGNPSSLTLHLNLHRGLGSSMANSDLACQNPEEATCLLVQRWRSQRHQRRPWGCATQPSLGVARGGPRKCEGQDL